MVGILYSTLSCGKDELFVFTRQRFLPRRRRVGLSKARRFCLHAREISSAERGVIGPLEEPCDTLAQPLQGYVTGRWSHERSRGATCGKHSHGITLLSWPDLRGKASAHHRPRHHVLSCSRQLAGTEVHARAGRERGITSPSRPIFLDVRRFPSYLVHGRPILTFGKGSG